MTAQTWDAELTQLFTRGRYSFDLSGGVRWGEIDDQVAPVLTESFNGWGSTVALSASRQLGNGPFSLIGGARGSLLFGDHVVNIVGAPIASSQEVMPVLEMQLGGEYSQELWGTHAFARAAFETQLWELPPTALGLLDQNIGFVGVTFSTGIRF
ncbi:Lpg1974 family pore-forming outer membrane protein [Rosistilla ulvae]|uniref:Lpg1974 family pore-forming outer membrane protein n=1 Tax=Rosistilla ulvae TaxID=1930277 RepID=UPI0011A82D0D|nr:Lpg1974 family pore-forming outer membrane protein [Rosistilla ulvae]